MDSLSTPMILGALALSYFFYRCYARTSLDNVPGPKPESFWLGNLRELFQLQVGEAEFKWQEEFGGVIRIKAPFGENRLLVSDPKALQYIFHTSGYIFAKEPERRAVSRLISGPGVLWANGDIHKRQKRVMSPGFGVTESRAFLPLFRACAEKITSQWKDAISGTSDQSAVFNIHFYLVRATLDAIGEAAFDYNFGAMENAENQLGRSYNNLLADMFGSPSTAGVFFQAIARYLPMTLIDLLVDYAPSPRMQRARDTGKLATGIAKELIGEKRLAMEGGSVKRDVMSLMLSSNANKGQNEKMEEKEVLAQMRSLMVAGHETTANTLAWTLYELAKQPEIQKKLREEIWATEQAFGISDLTAKEFDSMIYTTAVMKEALRFHPVSYSNYREAIRDDIIPMSRPLTKTSGEVVTEIAVPKGTKVILSIAGYNRDKSIWGDDAHTFRPERWLDGTISKDTSTNLGLYGNMPTFSGGVRSCLGWRFALVEFQSFLIELVGRFEFSLTPEVSRLRREACIVMVPTLEGEERKGAQMPLRVSVISSCDL